MENKKPLSPGAFRGKRGNLFAFLLHNKRREDTFMTEIKSLDQWRSLAALLQQHGFRLWQMQFDASRQGGFHAWFAKSGQPDMEIVTRYEVVQAEIEKFGTNKNPGKC